MSATHAGTTLLEAHDLSRHFDAGRTRALDGVDLVVRAHEFVAVMGPSGCGKSSLLNLLGALDSPTSGRLSIGAQPYPPVHRAARFRREHFGFIFQSFHLIPTLTSMQNILVAAIGAPTRRTEQVERAHELLLELGLERRAHHYPSQLSGGERQRVAIARALINFPKIVLADEPTGSLDSGNASQVLDLVDRLRSRIGLTIVMVTHDGEVARRADRVVRLRDGRIDEREGAAA